MHTFDEFKFDRRAVMRGTTPGTVHLISRQMGRGVSRRESVDEEEKENRHTAAPVALCLAFASERELPMYL